MRRKECLVVVRKGDDVELEPSRRGQQLGEKNAEQLSDDEFVKLHALVLGRRYGDAHGSRSVHDEDYSPMANPPKDGGARVRLVCT